LILPQSPGEDDLDAASRTSLVGPCHLDSGFFEEGRKVRFASPGQAEILRCFVRSADDQDLRRLYFCHRTWGDGQ
jgi:hypothetical protein